MGTHVYDDTNLTIWVGTHPQDQVAAVRYMGTHVPSLPHEPKIGYWQPLL